MRIVCPHCTTSYAVDAAALGSGRMVRCARCKEQWLARPDAPVYAEAMAAATADHAAAVGDEMPAAASSTPQPAEMQPADAPMVESPPIAGDWPDEPIRSSSPAGPEIPATSPPPRGKHKPRAASRPARPRLFNLPTACAAMGALVVALVMWRTDVVRLLPQTATFYKAIGLQVNLRGLAFKDLKVASETVEGKPVLVVEGVVVSESRKPVELPRLRFAVRDQNGQEIYAWNAILDQAVLKPGDTAWFRSRLAAPPPEGRHIDVRFFNKRDLTAAGGKA